jgi:CcmD family protein
MKKLLATMTLWLAPAMAMAQPSGDYEKFQGKAAEQISAGPFIAGAYGFIWAAVLVYVLALARKLARTRAEVDELQRRLERR